MELGWKWEEQKIDTSIELCPEETSHVNFFRGHDHVYCDQLVHGYNQLALETLDVMDCTARLVSYLYHRNNRIG